MILNSEDMVEVHINGQVIVYPSQEIAQKRMKQLFRDPPTHSILPFGTTIKFDKGEGAVKLKIHKVDDGFSRIVYQGRNRHGQKVYYAIQVWRGEYEIMRLCPKLEPQEKVMPRVPLKDLFEVPTGMSDLATGIRNFIISPKKI